jgi:hypothetical protein
MFVKTLRHLHSEIIKRSEGVKFLGREGCGSGPNSIAQRLHDLAAGGSQKYSSLPKLVD